MCPTIAQRHTQNSTLDIKREKNEFQFETMGMSRVGHFSLSILRFCCYIPVEKVL